jgi:hypothetical protein
MTTLTPSRKLFGDGIDECPECAHIWTDGSEGHYADCRYRLYEEDFAAEETGNETDNILRWPPWSLFNSAA